MQDGRIQDGCHHQVESEWMSEVFFVQNGWMQDGRIQDGCHHQVRWEWMSLSQIELVWVPSYSLTLAKNGSHHLHKKTYSHFPPHHLHKKTWLTHSFSHNLMMAAILNSAILDSTILHKTLTQPNSMWLKLIHSLSTWWWQPSRTLPSWIHQFCAKLWLNLIQISLKLIHSHLTWWWQPSSIWPSWIQPSDSK